MIDERTLRLQARFELIREALGKTVGKDVAFLAALGAWGITIQHLMNSYLDQVQKEPDRTEEFKQEIHSFMISWHSNVCKHLNIDQGMAVDLIDHFEQVMRDILNGRG